MSSELNLHTFARRYCIDRIDYWQKKYEPINEAAFRNMGSDGYKYSDEAYDTFPRYNVLDAILLGVETLDPEDLPHVHELAKLLSNIGYCASSDFTGKSKNRIVQQAQQDERDKFVEAIEIAATGELTDQNPLFYRRVLDPMELTERWRMISDKWGATWEDWYPFGRHTHPSLVALKLTEVNWAKLERALRKFISYPGAERVYELREYGRANYVLDAEAASLHYNFAEGYWFTQSNDWIIHCSHELTVTLGGTTASVARKYWPAESF